MKLKYTQTEKISGTIVVTKKVELTENCQYTELMGRKFEMLVHYLCGDEQENTPKELK